MGYPETFNGWAAKSKDCLEGKFEKWEFTPKTWEETDVDIKIQYCGICASDLHTASSGWGQVEYPIVVGHEIVGEVVRVGSKVTHVKVGDIAGVGAQCGSCLGCPPCKSDKEPYCDNGQVGTYNGKFYLDGPAKGDRSQGGYASYNRSPGHFVCKIPDGLDAADAAPALCGGVTVYSPLKKYGAGTTAKDVGIIGLGGLGHFGVIFAAHMGANVTVVSHSHSKEEDAKKMGAKNFIATHGDGDVFKKNRRSLDLLICTTNDSKMPLSGYLDLLRPGGTLCFVGLPEGGIPQISPAQYILGNKHVCGSAIGSPAEITEMLELMKSEKISGWVKKWSMADVNKAVPSMHKGDARYRYVLVNEENGGEL